MRWIEGKVFHLPPIFMKHELLKSQVGTNRAFGKPEYSAEQAKYLRNHAIILSRGKLDGTGGHASDPESLKSLFEVRLPEALKVAKRNGHPLRVMFWAHGGLVSEAEALGHVLSHGKIWEASGIYPIYFVWKTGILESFRSIMQGQRTSRGFITDPLVEAAFRAPASAVWSEIKSFASLSSQPSGGATLAASLFQAFYQKHAGSVVCYACGHSAGSIFHAHWLPLLAAAGVPVKELFLLAPAITVDLFASSLQGHIGRDKPIENCSMFTMFEKSERRDNVIHIYRKSLLYFVSKACEPMYEEPILGLEECLRTDPGMHAFWGLDPHGRATGEMIFSPSGTPLGLRASTSVTHGGFDNDPATLNSLARRMTGNLQLTPFDAKNSRSLLGIGTDARGIPVASPKEAKKLEVKIHLRLGGITDPLAGTPKIDYRVAGHYEGVEPASAEKYLDWWVSGIKDGNDGREGIVTGMTRRGTMGGTLGQTAILAKEGHGAAVFLGLGKYGSLGPAELATAVRELCLQISQLKGTHVATVLIGSGNGNMSLSSAMDAWLRGISHAQEISNFSIKCITFVEFDAKRFLELEAVLAKSLARYLHTGSPCSPAEYEKARKEAARTSIAKVLGELDQLAATRANRNTGETANRSPRGPRFASSNSGSTSRITVRAEKDYYSFTALTDAAAVPERLVRIDPRIIDEIARAIAAASDPAELEEWGRTLQKMIVPRDLHSRLFSSAAHVVMTLDASTARIPWEMMIIPGTPTGEESQFMSLAEGFGVTRQLQTGFAPVPERQRAARQSLSVLIVSDPAADAPLPGAAREGEEVEAYFSGLADQNGLRIVHLSGPDATRANVSKELCNHGFDILHFAGHCYFNAEAPGKSGWIFRGDPLEVFSADELLRIDRVPPFIFSNACESGITPDRAHEQNPSIGPAFAEAFFAQGVSNIVCTGWPVDDLAATEFTRTFYEQFHGQGGLIKDAMFKARQAAWDFSPNTAGAYQHYGNPFYLLSRD